MNCTIHTAPHAARLATTANMAVTPWLQPECSAMSPTMPTTTVDRIMPARVRPTNGAIWRRNDGLPLTPQTHRRFSSNDGTIPAAVATTLAGAGRIVPLATSTVRMLMLVVVATTEVAA